MDIKNSKSIKRSLALLTIFLLLISAIEMLVSIQGSNSLTKNLKNISEVQMPSIRLITLLDMMHDGLRAVVFHSLLVSASKDEDQSVIVKEELKEFTANFHEYLSTLKLLGLNSTIKEALEKVEAPLNEYIQTSSSIVETALSGKAKEAMNELPLFQLSFKKLESQLEVLGELIEKEADKGKEQSLIEANRNDVILKMTALMGALMGIIFFIFITRSTVSS